MSNDQAILNLPRTTTTHISNHDSNTDFDASAEAIDVLPSLPSSSSSLFVAHTYRGNGIVGGRSSGDNATTSRRRVTSLYGNPSIAASDATSIEGSSTYEYDVSSNIRKQQLRRRRGDSNASISTVASMLSRNQSIAESLTPSILAYERDGHARGQFTTPGSKAASRASSIRGDDESSTYDYTVHGGGAAASLRRIRKASDVSYSGRRENAHRKSAMYHNYEGASDRAESHLSDKLEQLIASSTSYRAAHARGNVAQYEGAQGGTGWFQQRDRKHSYASMRSLIGFTSANSQQENQQRQTSNGDYYSPTSRAASLFGVYMGKHQDATSVRHGALRSGTPLRSPTWAQISGPSAPLVASIDGEQVTFPAAQATSSTTSKVRGNKDAIGSLRGLNALFPREQLRSQQSRNGQAKTRTALDKRLTISTTAPAETGNTLRRSPKKSPTSPSSLSRERQRHVSFQTTSGGKAKESPPSPSALSSRRAFAAIDPTSSVANSGTATPRTVRSISPSLKSVSRSSSRLDLPTDATALERQSEAALSTASTSGNSGSGAMPALDAALARAEDRSGLKTSSRCTSCNKRVVNAPVSKSGDVFCSRDCRVETKRKRQEVAAAATASSNALPSTRTTTKLSVVETSAAEDSNNPSTTSITPSQTNVKAFPSTTTATTTTVKPPVASAAEHTTPIGATSTALIGGANTAKSSPKSALSALRGPPNAINPTTDNVFKASVVTTV